MKQSPRGFGDGGGKEKNQGETRGSSKIPAALGKKKGGVPLQRQQVSFYDKEYRKKRTKAIKKSALKGEEGEKKRKNGETLA